MHEGYAIFFMLLPNGIKKLKVYFTGDMLWASTSGPQGPQNQRRYVGEYVEDVRNGKGEMTYPNGDIYSGEIY